MKVLYDDVRESKEFYYVETPASRSGASASRRRATFLDASETSYLENMLTSYDPIITEEIKGDMTGLSVFPITLIPAGTKTHEYFMSQSRGKAKYTSLTSNDTPLATGSTIKVFQNTASMTIGYKFSIEDIEAGVKASLTPSLPFADPILVARSQCLRGCLELMNATVYAGAASIGLKGILNNSVITNSKAVAKSWQTATQDEMLADLVEAYDSLCSTTLATIMPDTCLMSSALFTRVNFVTASQFRDASVKEIFEKRTGVQIVRAFELNQGFSGGKDGFVMYRRRADCVEHIISTLFEEAAPDKAGFGYSVVCRAAHGGLVIKQPLSVCIRTQP